MSAARTAALRIRTEVERGRRLDRAFGATVEGLAERDRAFVHELTYGTTRLRGRLDHLIGLHVDRGLSSLDATVLEVLRLGAYQALYMHSVPVFAAVSEAVDQVREVAGPRPTGLVNAVLRKVAERGDGPDAYPDPERDPLGFLETWGSHPRWLVERWLARWPFETVKTLVETDNRRPKTFLMALDLGTDAVLERLERAGIAAESVADGPTCVRLPEGAHPATALAAVPGSIIQDPAAGLVARYADVPSGTVVADLCAAPGGKALAVSGRAAHLLAADLSEPRIRMVKENSRRTGRAVSCVVADALRPPLRQADVVLLDVPCSGTGTLARHPDARWRLEPEGIRRFAGLQDRMLEAAVGLVPPGGLLVYSTCTLEPEENEDRIDRFLGTHADFGIDSTGAVPGEMMDAEGRLSIMPWSAGFDGAFAARMRRTG
ncbi:MAG: transcription antitermination factor NusB [Gemmatimonadota bacterium]